MARYVIRELAQKSKSCDFKTSKYVKNFSTSFSGISDTNQGSLL
jgi:type 1 fimbria pilin